MRTIHECLIESDAERIAGCLTYMYPLNYIDFYMLGLEKMPYEDVMALEKERVIRIIEKMRSIQPDVPDPMLVLYGTCGFEIERESFSLRLVPVFRFLDPKVTRNNPENTPDYGVNFTPWKQSLGFYVSDEPMTQNFLNEALAAYIHEASIFGDSPETQQNNADGMIKKLNKSLNELKKENVQNLDEKKYEMFNEKLRKRRSVFEDEDEDLKRLNEAVYDFLIKCRTEKRKKIIANIYGENTTTNL